MSDRCIRCNGKDFDYNEEEDISFCSNCGMVWNENSTY